jgi:hypothetical protein
MLSVRKNPFLKGTPTWRLVMEVSGGTGTANGLACFIFRFLRRPLQACRDTVQGGPGEMPVSQNGILCGIAW